MKVHQRLRHLEHVFRVVRSEVGEQLKRGLTRVRRRTHRADGRHAAALSLGNFAGQGDVVAVRVVLVAVLVRVGVVWRAASGGDGVTAHDVRCSPAVAADHRRGHPRQAKHLRGWKEHRNRLGEQTSEHQHLHEAETGGFGPDRSTIEALDEALNKP
eukprot:30628-Pelagococcus_subviridis.AAC.4